MPSTFLPPAAFSTPCLWFQRFDRDTAILHHTGRHEVITDALHFLGRCQRIMPSAQNTAAIFERGSYVIIYTHTAFDSPYIRFWWIFDYHDDMLIGFVATCYVFTTAPVIRFRLCDSTSDAANGYFARGRERFDADIRYLSGR
jgi:hypothetical protein